jgi:hypothetical protein
VLAAGCLAIVLAVPSLLTFGTFLNVATTGQGSTGVGAIQFGQLLRKLPISQTSGVWLSGEYRLPIPSGLRASLTVVATIVIFLALIPGLLLSLRRRQAGPLMMLGVMGLVLLIVFPRVSPYGQGKLLAIASPAVVLVALSGLMSLRGRLSLPALSITGTLVVAVLASDALAYAHDRVAPTDRIEAVREVGHRFRGQGLVLWNEFEEYAKYLANPAWISAPFEAITPQQVQLRAPTYFYGHYFDLDEELLSFVDGYPIIVTRRSPAASRPPANYTLVYSNKYYLGWRRTPTPEVLRHQPEQTPYSATAPATCMQLKTLVAGAPAGSELLLATSPETAIFSPLSDPSRSAGWDPDPNEPGAVTTNTAGHAEGTVNVHGNGRYSVWVQGDFPRKIYVQVDGRTVGWVAGSNTPGQWLQASSLELSPGVHKVRVFKVPGHRHLGPGEWGDGTIGAVALQRAQPQSLRTVSVGRWRTLCDVQADWVELIRP